MIIHHRVTEDTEKNRLSLASSLPTQLESQTKFRSPFTLSKDRNEFGASLRYETRPV